MATSPKAKTQPKKTVQAVDVKKQRAEAAAKKAEQAAKRAEAAAKKVANVGAKHMKGHLGGFVDFVREQGIIGLAVGLAIGTAAGVTVKDIVNGFINPIVQFIVGSGTKLADATWHVELFGRTADFAWGAALSSTITLIATALVIYWLVNIFKLDRLDKKKDA